MASASAGVLLAAMLAAVGRPSSAFTLLDVPAAIADPARSDEDVMAAFVAASEMICRALPDILAFELEARPVLVADGAWLLPAFVAALTLPDADIRSVFLRHTDAASVAAVRALERTIGRRAGGSTGTGLWSALKIIAEMVAEGRRGSVVTLLCDPGDRYLDKYYSDAWLAEQGLDIEPYTAAIASLLETGIWPGHVSPGRS